MLARGRDGHAVAQGGPSPKDLLKLQPILKGVDYETPADDSAVASCKIETVYNAQKKAIGYALRDGQGKLLRRFADADGKGGMDQWSYYQDGFEVYRETDLNNDRGPDECRWLKPRGRASPPSHAARSPVGSGSRPKRRPRSSCKGSWPATSP